MTWRISFLFLAFFTVAAHGATIDKKSAYYGKNFFSEIEAGKRSANVILFEVLSGAHQTASGDYDTISENCGGPNCYRQTAVGYRKAREFMFGDFYLVKQGANYGVKDVYCARIANSDEFTSGKPGPNKIPDSKVMNAEHTWPQSQFSRSFPEEDQKSDMHHLFPTDSEMNSKRSSLKFGDVVSNAESLKCSEARLGNPRSGQGRVFEPPVSQKGNTARALFYFGVRYGLHIDAEEEATLKEWNHLDPVDAEEIARNDRIFDLQKSRNPFVDFPELVDKVKDF